MQHEKHTELSQSGEERIETIHDANSPNQSNTNSEVEQTPTEEGIIRVDIEAIHKEHGTKKKRKSDPEAWAREINKKKRESGKEYVGRKYTSKDEFILETKPSKVMGARCECKTSFTECSTLTDEDRQSVFEAVWKFQWAERKQFVTAMTFKKDVSKQTTKDGDSRRSDTIMYMLKAKDGKKKSG